MTVSPITERDRLAAEVARLRAERDAARADVEGLLRLCVQPLRGKPGRWASVSSPFYAGLHPTEAAAREALLAAARQAAGEAP